VTWQEEHKRKVMARVLSQVEDLFESEQMPIDVALIQVKILSSRTQRGSQDGSSLWCLTNWEICS
jgi:hypothetical protein